MNAVDQRVAVDLIRNELWAVGFRPVPLMTGDKRPIAENREIIAKRNPPGAAIPPVIHDAMNTDILWDGQRVLDLDIEDSDIVAKVRRLATEILESGAPIQARPNSPRRAPPYLAASGEPGKRSISSARGKIEVLGRDSQLHASGRPASGVELEWTLVTPGEVRQTAGGMHPGRVVTKDDLAALANLNVRTIDRLMGAGEGATNVVRGPGRKDFLPGDFRALEASQ